MAYCPSCGNLLKEDDVFCSKCGKPLKEVQSQSPDVYLHMNREKAYVASLTKYKVCFTGVEVGSISNGETKIFKCENRNRFMLKVYPWGDSMSLHKMACEVEIDPSRCKNNSIKCIVKTETKVAGILAPLFSAPGKISIHVEYQ